MANGNAPGDDHVRKDNRIEDIVIIIVIEDEAYSTLDWCLGGFRIGGFKSKLVANAEFLVSGIGPDLDNIFEVRIDCQAIRLTDDRLSASFIEIDSDVYDILEAMMLRREKPLEKLKKQLPYGSMAQRFKNLADDNVRKLYAAYLKLEAATGDRKAELKAVYSQALDIKNQGTNLGYDLMTEVCNELCLLIEKLDGAGPKEVEVIRLHIESMKLVIAKNMKGGGGEVGEEMLSGLQKVCSSLKP